MREVEIEKLYVDCAEEILAGIKARTDEDIRGHLSLGSMKDNATDGVGATFASFSNGRRLSQLRQWWWVVLRRLQSIW